MNEVIPSPSNPMCIFRSEMYHVSFMSVHYIVVLLDLNSPQMELVVIVLSQNVLTANTSIHTTPSVLFCASILDRIFPFLLYILTVHF